MIWLDFELAVNELGDYFALPSVQPFEIQISK